MILVCDTEYLSINRKLRAYNLFNGINLQLKNILNELDNIYYFTYSELGIIQSGTVINPNYSFSKYNDELSKLIYGISIAQIKSVITEKEDLIIVADKSWYKIHTNFVKAIIDILDNNVLVLGYGEEINEELIRNYFYQYLDIESLSLNEDYINNLWKEKYEKPYKL